MTPEEVAKLYVETLTCTPARKSEIEKMLSETAEKNTAWVRGLMDPKHIKAKTNPNFDRRDFDSSCCDNEKRNMNGGCDNCGDPSF